MSVVLGCTDGDPARLRRLGPARFEAAVRREVVARQGKRPCRQIVRLLFVAAADPWGVTAHRPGALERTRLLLDGFRDTQHRLGETEARMVAVLDELQLTELVCSIVGLSALGGASILAETGDRPGSPPPVLWSNTPVLDLDTGPPDQVRPPRPLACRPSGGSGQPGHQERPSCRRPVGSPNGCVWTP